MKIPKARQLESGTWFIQLRVGGVSTSGAFETQEQAEAWAIGIKSGLIQERKPAGDITLGKAMDEYIDKRVNVLSPSTIRGYRTIRKMRFTSVMDKPMRRVKDWQAVVNSEAVIYSGKTLRNSWMLVKSVAREHGIEVKATLPQVVHKERQWLTPEQIPKFVQAVRGRSYEIPSLLALHGLRRSEIYGLTWDKVDLVKNTITVSGAAVLNEKNELVQRAENKSAASRRVVPIMIPALAEALRNADDKSGLIVKANVDNLYKRIIWLCEQNGLPLVGVHGLRHSFASLCYHLEVPELVTMRLGGWSDYNTVHRIYTHLAEKDVNDATELLSNYFKTLTENANDLQTVAAQRV